MPGFHSTQEQAHDRNRDVGERRTQVRLDQHHQHGNADQCSGLDDVLGRTFRLCVGEIFSHRENKHQLHPLRRLKVKRAQLHPATRAQILLAEHLDRNQRRDGNQVHQRYTFQQRLVVEEADHEHQPHAAQDPVQLFQVYTHKLGAESCAVDFDNAQGADQQHEHQQDPVEIAE